MNTRLRILLTNDDGYPAAGLRKLYSALGQAHDVTVVAPMKEQSGVGHAFTFHAGLQCRALDAQDGMHGYAVGGTPSDCVKLALAQLLTEQPAIVVSGINIGENTGMAACYSGTLAAAREAAFWRITAVAFSVCVEGMVFIDSYAKIARSLVERLVHMHANGFKNEHNRIFFNINFPACAPDECKGIRITRQSMAFFDDRYRAEDDGSGGTVFRLYGSKKDIEQSDDFDSCAVENGYIAITPLHFDATAEDALGRLSELTQPIR